ncbi:hypothetical protein TrLO_g12562 [Triparma laevis f. longispina]|uniref:Uncharacterized protein n=1 Tax=Triparma laevis f. longispina TaxID=1714387 RepID=A0A9W6ZRX5_9STRA|nr:hypothetical protein TrLO_g12562 [Triparma laevis f. longispina]
MRFYLILSALPLAIGFQPLGQPCIRRHDTELLSQLETREEVFPNLNDYTDKEMSVFSASTRLLLDRRYAKNFPFKPENVKSTPTIFDLSPPRKLTSSDPERRWLSLPFRAAVVLGAYVLFPPLVRVIFPLIDQSNFQIDQVVSSFVPGISILFGTLCSLTANILYQRQARLQQTASEEASLLASITQDSLHLLRRPEHKELRVAAAQSAADYIATLVGDSRGSEIMRVCLSDPVMEITKCVQSYEIWCDERNTDLGAAGALVSNLRTCLSEIGVLRARRLSDEALALPPTHFLILGLLSTLILAGFVLASLGSVAIDPVTNVAAPSFESNVLFAVLTGVYTLFFNFSRDLNSPFEGVYQIRRSQTASYLIKTKRVIVSAGVDVDFGYDDEGNRQDASRASRR